MAKIDLVVKQGNDPNCVHFEDIVNQIGVCRKCGRVKDYRLHDPDEPHGKGVHRGKKKRELKARISSGSR
jgi:hypothetical protein